MELQHGKRYTPVQELASDMNTGNRFETLNFANRPKLTYGHSDRTSINPRPHAQQHDAIAAELPGWAYVKFLADKVLFGIVPLVSLCAEPN